jgi:ADP-ribose pyrophosphatase
LKKAKLVSSRKIFEGRVVNLAVERVILPNGNESEIEVIHHRGAAAVVPVDAERQAFLVRQYRHAAGDWLLEVPAGKLDGGEPPEVCATREIREEVGREAGTLTPMGWIYTTPGFTDEKIWLYLATDLRPTEQALEDDEVLSIVRMPLDEAVAMAKRGEITDAKSICALLRAPEFIP